MLNRLFAANQRFSPRLHRLFSNASWLIADRFLRMGIGLFVSAWVARYLGPHQFGIYNYVFAFISLFSMVATLGLDQIVVRDIVRDPACKDVTLGTTFALKFVSGVVTLLLTTGTVFLLRPNDTLTHWLVGIIAAGIIFEAFNTIDFWFQLQVQSKFTVYAKNSAFLIITFVKVALIQMHAPLVAFAWAALAESALGALGLVIAYQGTGQKFRAWCLSSLRAKTLLKDSWPLIVSGLAIIVYLRIDQIMLGELVGNEAVGIYSVTVKVSEVWFFIPSAIVSSTTPLIIEAKSFGEALYYNKLQKLFNLLAVLAYSVAIPMTFFATDLVILVFGKTYAPAGGVLGIHIWSGVFVFLGMAKGAWAVAEGLTTYFVVAYWAGAILNILLNLWLIPIYEESGAAIATVISYGFSDYFMSIIYPPYQRIAWVMTKAMALTFLLEKTALTNKCIGIVRGLTKKKRSK